MAIGDLTPTELIAPSALSTAATAKFTNTSASFRTEMTGIWICNTGASQRTVSLYKNGTAVGNQIATIVLGPVGSATLASSAFIDLTGKPLVLTGTQVIAAKQDVGADVNIAAYGIVEQIA